jgi:alpha-ketoglutarate-dependent 2,4-dichlorophenoxyacetate dioxygenase
VPITLNAITPDFVAEVGDVDLSKPLTSDDLAAIKSAFWKYAVLIFPGQKLSEENHHDFALTFGPIEADRVLDPKLHPHRVSSTFSDISNLMPDGKIWEAQSRQRMYKEGNKLWHTDSSFKYTPSLCSLLYATTVVPIGGHTEFADQRAAYDALPADMKQMLTGMIAEHCIAYSRRKTGFDIFTADEAKRMPPVPQALVRTIPESGRKTLYIASHIGRILGMSDAEAARLVEQLAAHVTQRQFVYTHRWRPDDLVMWDNRCTLHRGTDFDDLRWVRDMRRATVSDRANSCVQEGLTVPA